MHQSHGPQYRFKPIYFPLARALTCSAWLLLGLALSSVKLAEAQEFSTLSFQVVDAAGRGLEGASVCITSNLPKWAQYRARTDASGRVAFPRLNVGSVWRVEGSKASYASAKLEVLTRKYQRHFTIPMSPGKRAGSCFAPNEVSVDQSLSKSETLKLDIKAVAMERAHSEWLLTPEIVGQATHYRISSGAKLEHAQWQRMPSDTIRLSGLEPQPKYLQVRHRKTLGSSWIDFESKVVELKVQ